MSTRTVTTQAELDAALADESLHEYDEILIQSPHGVWLEISTSATGSATVSATGSATVHAYGSATVHAYGSATVRASKYVAVHLYSAKVTHTGGVLIDVTDLDLTDTATWLDYTGTEHTDGKVTLYKAVDDQWLSPHGARYEPGTTTIAPDWRADAECGHGLHFGPTPTQATAYFEGATKWVAVEVDVDTLRPIPGGVAKAKAPSCRVLHPVDVMGRQIKAPAAVTE